MDGVATPTQQLSRELVKEELLPPWDTGQID